MPDAYLEAIELAALLPLIAGKVREPSGDRGDQAVAPIGCAIVHRTRQLSIRPCQRNEKATTQFPGEPIPELPPAAITTYCRPSTT